MYTANPLCVYYSNLLNILFVFLYLNHMFRHSGCDSVLNVLRRTILPKPLPNYSKGVCMIKKTTKKYNKCVFSVKDRNRGGDLFNGAQHACLASSQLVFS